MAKHSSRILEMARKGAEYRYQELKAELANLVETFPHLARGGRRATANDSGPRRRRRSHMSPAARRATSIRMKKYWAERRKAKK